MHTLAILCVAMPVTIALWFVCYTIARVELDDVLPSAIVATVACVLIGVFSWGLYQLSTEEKPKPQTAESSS